MLVPILVATPHPAFGELLRLSLEESGQYHVRLVQSGREARKASSHAAFQLAILDAALQDEPFTQLCVSLLQQQVGLRLMIVPPENNPNHPALGGLLPHGYLSRPFYLPDLLETVARLLADREKQMQAQARLPGDIMPASVYSSSNTLPPWLEDAPSLCSYLGKELAGTQALAAMAGLNEPDGSGTLRATAGSFEEAAFQELASVVFRYWNRNEKTDLMRFIRLTQDKRDYLIYATQITGDLVLILVYDTAAPLSQIRPQTKAIAQTIASLPPEGYGSQAAAGQKIQGQNGAARIYPAAAETPTGPFEAVPEAMTLPEAKAAPEMQAAETTENAQRVPPAEDASRPPAEAISRSALVEPDTQPYLDLPYAEPARPAPEPAPSEQTPPLVENAPAQASSEADMATLRDALSAEEGEEGTAVFNLSALLGNIPAPDPDSEFSNTGWGPERFAGQNIPTIIPSGNNSYDRYDRPERNDYDRNDRERGRQEWDWNSSAQPNAQDDIPAWITNAGNPPSTPLEESLQQAADAQDRADAVDRAGAQDRAEPGALPQAEELPQTKNLPQAENLPQTAQLPTLDHLPRMVEPPHPETAERLAADELMAADEILSSREIEPEAPRVRRPASAEPNTEPPIPPMSAAGPVEIRLPGQAAGLPSLPAEPPVNALEDTRPRLVSAINNLNQLEPASPALSLLNYTCVLVPRLPQHYLTGDLADRLAMWVQQMCLAFGWRLEGISIRPEYLQWSVQVAPAVSPGNLVKIIRQRTSMSIFGAFDHLAQQNPSGDFWAPGYLIVSGAQPPSAQLLREYIAQTRKRQGITK